MFALPNRTAAGVTAVSLAVAGGAHIAAYGRHLSEGILVAAFFAVVAALQIAASLLVPRGGRARLRAGIVAGNVALVALWAWSRTSGLQVGPTAGMREPLGVLDLVAVAAQVVAVTAAVTVPHARVVGRVLRPQLALVAVALLVGAAGLRLPAAAADHHFEPDSPSYETHPHEAQEHAG